MPDSSASSTHGASLSVPNDNTGRGESVGSYSAAAENESKSSASRKKKGSRSNKSREPKSDSDSVSTNEADNHILQIRLEHVWVKGQLDEEMRHMNVGGKVRDFNPEPNEEPIFQIRKRVN